MPAANLRQDSKPDGQLTSEDPCRRPNPVWHARRSGLGTSKLRLHVRVPTVASWIRLRTLDDDYSVVEPRGTWRYLHQASLAVRADVFRQSLPSQGRMRQLRASPPSKRKLGTPAAIVSSHSWDQPD